MDPLSAIASVIAIYQLASVVGAQCFRYVRGVRQADKDGDLVMAQIEIFQRSLRHLQGMLADEDSNTRGGSRLKLLAEIIDGDSASLRACTKELERIQTKLAKAQSDGGFKGAIHKLGWPLKQEEVNKTITTLNSFAGAVDRALSIDTSEAVRGIDNTTKEIASTTKGIQNAMEITEVRRKQEEKLRKEKEERQKAQDAREKILDWLAHPDPSENHNVACRARNNTAKTGRWFLDGAVFQEFRETPGSILWLHGESGCGKSILCSAIIDKLQAIQAGDSQIELAYWYFSVNDTKRRSLQNLVRTLITQLVPNSSAPSALVEFWEARKKSREAPKTSDLIQVLGSILSEKNPRVCFIIIDALDESDELERPEVMDLIQTIALLDNANLRVLVTSRTNTIGVERALKDVTRFFNIAIEMKYADEDILAHITERLENDDDLRKWPLHIRDEIKKTLTENAAGMFRWVDFQLQAIGKCRKPAELKRALTSLPKDLHEAYVRELENVDERNSEDVGKLLEWLTFPQRPLRIEEAVDMLAVDLDSDPPSFDEGLRMLYPEDVLEICGSLIRVDKNFKGRNSLGELAEVRTLTAAHASVVDFLKAQPIRISSHLATRLTRSTVNLRMAETCLIYLKYFVERGLLLTEDNIVNYPFARLSAELWDDFYREVVACSEEEPVTMTRLNDLVMELFSSSEAMLKWVQLCDPDEDTDRVHFDLDKSRVKPALYYAALLGLPDIVNRLIDEGHHVDQVVTIDHSIDQVANMVNMGCGTPLVAACAYGRKDIVSLLLDRGADPTLSGFWYRGCPLAAAIEVSEVEIVKMLLKRESVDINGTRAPAADMKTTSLSYQSKEEIEIVANMTEKITHIDEDNGTEPVKDDTSDEYWTSQERMNNVSSESMAYIATTYGSTEQLEILLEEGADPDLEGGLYCTALQAACGRNDELKLRLLLSKGANVGIDGGKHGSALQAACSCATAQIAQHLIEAGADVNHTTSDKPCSALYLACEVENMEIIDLLIEQGAKVDLYGGLYDNPLQVACENGNIAVVKKLLQAGSQVNRQGGKWRTALYIACDSGKIDVVRLLLDYHADPNIQGCGPFDNALQTVSIGDYDGSANPDLVSLLIDNGANPNLRGGECDNSLQAAFSSGSETVINILLDRGADSGLKGGVQGNNLQAAVVSAKKAAVDIALSCGIPANVKGGPLTYPLLRAASSPSIPDSILLTLLENGADPNLQSEGDGEAESCYRTALQSASSDSKLALLLDHGARINDVGGICGTALNLKIVLAEDSSSMIELLLKRGADVNKTGNGFGFPLSLACQLGKLDIVKLLVEAGADRDQVDQAGRSILHQTICSPEEYGAIWHYLIGLGADPLLEDRRGCNGLHYAARCHNFDALEYMLKRGTNVNATDSLNWTPLHWAAASSYRSVRVIRLLLESGCDRDATDKQGRTALDLATCFHNTTGIALLEANSEVHLDLPDDRVSKDGLYCDGCGVKREICKPERWHHCNGCEGFDFCFRCIMDKDIIHYEGHTFSEEAA